MEEIFQTRDPDVAESMLQASYGGRMRIDAGGERAGVRLESAALTPAARLDHIVWAMNFEVTSSPIGVLVIAQIRSGRASYASGGSERGCLPGDIFIPVQPDDPSTTRCAQPDFTMVTMDPGLPGQVADTEPRRRPQPVRFTGYEPVSEQVAARRWEDAYAYVSDLVVARPGAAAQPLLYATAARLLAATALDVFPNNALADPTIEDRHDAHPATLRRAVAFIEENADLDISVAGIAAAASVTTRAVQLAFRRHLDTTPMEYLRRVRLEHAHHDLKQATPGDGTTVTTVAYRWGFGSSSRFAAAYRRAYGVMPTQTLRS